MHKGHIIFLLHAHLPFVRHPEYEYFLEENWLFEAMIETYIPLIRLFERLSDEGVEFKVTLSLSPTLVEMLDDGLLKTRFLRYLGNLIELTEKEIIRTKKDAALNPLARMYNKNLREIRHAYEAAYGSDLISALRRLSSTDEAGNIELITTAATHAYLPNLSLFPQAVKAQINTACLSHKRHFNNALPKGIWLPECGYYEGLDFMLKEEGIGFFFLESHGILHGNPKPMYGTFKPVITPSGLAAFGRDAASSNEVWSRTGGYPADPVYRDFYKDIGFELGMDYIKPYIHPAGIRTPTGIKYWRITGRSDRKKPYVREQALKTAGLHAKDFIIKREMATKELSRKRFSPVFTAPYDAELFGHWWFEGIDWLESVIRGLSRNPVIRMSTPSQYLSEAHDLQSVSPSMSSWGAGGYGSTWCSPVNDWALRHIHKACRLMSRLAHEFYGADDPLITRALNQAVRELLLMQASDWLFMMDRQTSPHYGEERLIRHIKAFGRLYDMITQRSIDGSYLSGLEDGGNGIFPFIDYRVYADRKKATAEAFQRDTP